MDDTLILFAWTLGGTLAFGLLGAAFGGLAGWLSWRKGNASGTVMARKVAEALARLVEQDMTDSQRGALIGGADGALLGLFGTLLGLVAGQAGVAPQSWLLPVFSATLLLVLGALVFGFLALGIVRLRLRAVLGVFLGGMMGAMLAARQLGVAHLVPGAVAGIILGTVVAAMLPAR